VRGYLVVVHPGRDGCEHTYTFPSPNRQRSWRWLDVNPRCFSDARVAALNITGGIGPFKVPGTTSVAYRGSGRTIVTGLCAG